MVVRRLACGALGGVVLPLLLTTLDPSSPRLAVAGLIIATASLAAVVAGELLERSLFFRTASPPRLSGRHA